MKTWCMVVVIGVAAGLLTVHAQQSTDVENSSDYPLLSRFQGAVIEFYQETRWGTYLLPVGDNGTVDWDGPMALEGRVIRIQYTASPDNNSEFILHNYRTAFERGGYEVLVSLANQELGFVDRPHTWHDMYYQAGGFYQGLNNGKFGMGVPFPYWNGNHGFIAARGHHAGKDIYAIIYAIVTEDKAIITQDVIEVEAAVTGLVSAAHISQEIAHQGRIAIYGLQFDADSARIRPESTEVLSRVAEFLQTNPDRRYFIVGHAAGIGDFAAGLSLSRERAQAVLNALADRHGIARARLEAHGVGALSPVASNRTAESAAMNRRVELVEQ